MLLTRNISAFRFGLFATLGGGLGFLTLMSVEKLSQILTYIGAALFIALGLDPLVSWLEKKTFPRWAAILTVVTGVLALFALLILFVVPLLIQEIVKFASQVPSIVSTLQSESFVKNLQHQFPGLDIKAISNSVTQSANDFVKDPVKIGSLAGNVFQIGLSIGAGIFGAIIVLILTLYFTASLGSIKRAIYQLVPATKRVRFAKITEEISESVGRYVVGQVVLAFCNGTLSFIFLTIIHAPFAPALACFAFLFSLVPLVGTLSGSVLIVLICLIPGLASPATALAAAIYYIIYMQIEAYVLSPHIMNRAVSVPGAVVVVAALAGGTLLGILGALVAIPCAAAILLILREVIIPKQNEA